MNEYWSGKLQKIRSRETEHTEVLARKAAFWLLLRNYTLK